ncbi:MAG: hypothetical protein WDN00_08235 [Limisphaerales bacterium]
MKWFFLVWKKFVACFARRPPEMTYAEAEQSIQTPLYSEDHSQNVQQHLAILNHPKEVMRSLHSVGFIGKQDSNSKNFVFCP